MKWRFIVPLCMLLVYVISGIYQVAPGEYVVIRRCGRILQESRGPGLHWGLPWGIDRVERVAVDEQRQLVLGYQDDGGPDDSLAPIVQATPTGQALTGDNQIVNVRVSIHYRVEREKLARYILVKNQIEEWLTKIADASLTEALAGEKIDQVLMGRSISLENRLRQLIAKQVNHYELGLLIDNVNLVSARPPTELVEVFLDVNRARSQRDIVMTEAQSKKNTDISLARQDADRIIAMARSNAHARLAQARSEADAFHSLLKTFPKEHQAASSALLQLYINDMQQILSRMQVRTLTDQGVEQVVILPLPAR